MSAVPGLPTGHAHDRSTGHLRIWNEQTSLWNLLVGACF